MLLLAKLDFLSLMGTNVDIAGLRLLAKTIFEEGRDIDIEIPYSCEHYIDSEYFPRLPKVKVQPSKRPPV